MKLSTPLFWWLWLGLQPFLGAQIDFAQDLPYLPPHLPVPEKAYGDLERLTRIHPDSTDTYLFQGLPYSGTAWADYPKHGQTEFYFIQSGKVVQRLGYYRSGQKRSEFNFRAGQSHGLHEIYYPDGRPYIREYYNQGRPHGYLQRWHRSGQLAREALYRSGQLVEQVFFTAEGLPTQATE